MEKNYDRDDVLKELHKQGIRPVFTELGVVDHFEVRGERPIGIKARGMIDFIGAHVIRA